MILSQFNLSSISVSPSFIRSFRILEISCFSIKTLIQQQRREIKYLLIDFLISGCHSSVILISELMSERILLIYIYNKVWCRNDCSHDILISQMKHFQYLEVIVSQVCESLSSDILHSFKAQWYIQSHQTPLQISKFIYVNANIFEIMGFNNQILDFLS